MRSPFSCRIAVASLLFFSCSAAAALGQAANPAGSCSDAETGQPANAIEIDYTGGLLGYYRMEAAEQTPVLKPVQAFLDCRGKNRDLLLGMGDNFGPEFGASLQLQGGNDGDACYLPPLPGKTTPESLYKNDNRVAPLAQCDNVLHFLMRANYRAIVPGSQDFMYTARWLRRTAILLAQTSNSGGHSALPSFSQDHRLYLLAANLRIVMKSRGGETQCPLFFSHDPLNKNAPHCLAGQPGQPLDPEPLRWLDRLDPLNRKNGINSTVTALAAESEAESPGNAALIDSIFRDHIAIMQAAWGRRLPALMEISPNQQHFTPEIVTGLSGKVNALKLDSTDSGDVADFESYKNRMMQTFARFGQSRDELKDCRGKAGGCFLLSPDSRAAAIRGLLRTVAGEEENVGYMEAAAKDGGKVLIVGVIGEGVLNEVSETNLELCPDGNSSSDSTNTFGACRNRAKAVNSHGPRVEATDPVPAIEAIVRGAELECQADTNCGAFARVVVMAQMPHTEAEILSERVSTRLRLDSAGHPVDVVLSESESGFDSPQQTFDFPASSQSDHAAPVLTPVASYSSADGSYPGEVSRLTLRSQADGSLSVFNQPDRFAPPRPQNQPAPPIDRLARLLPSSPFWKDEKTDPSFDEKAEFALLRDLQKAVPHKPDVVLLQSRDVELGKITEEYAGYGICDREQSAEDKQLCRLRSALDRIFWKGDYLEYVAVTGKDLEDILQLSEKKIVDQAQLADTGFTREWLIPYGIVQSALPNPSAIEQNGEPLWIPYDPSCKSLSSQPSTYCIGGVPIAPDAYYWVLTTDQLAEDVAVYGTFQHLETKYHKRTDTFVTAPLAKYLLAEAHGSHAEPAEDPPAQSNRPPSAETFIQLGNEQFQQRPHLQVDFAKLIAAFNSRQPVGGNTFVGDHFQGVSDARASAPTAQTLDLELGSRISDAPFPALARLSTGVQNTFAYDRAVIGNLSPSSKPINASYSLNNLTSGAFLQIWLDRDQQPGIETVRSVPRDLLVLTPHQYQVEIDHPYLFFPFAGNASTPGELTVHLPRTSGWSDRAGYRREFGNSARSLFLTGNYLEAGMELQLQNGVLSSLTLQTGANRKTCAVSAIVTLQTCFKNEGLPINSATVVVGRPAVQTLHSPGLYWDVHFQNRMWNQGGRPVSLVTNSVGDFFFGRSAPAELPTQTEYAIPLSVSLMIPAFGNLGFGPTYSAFFYQSQLSSQSLQVNAFSIRATWYFARDARVPVRRQFPLPGPQSADQTRTSQQ